MKKQHIILLIGGWLLAVLVLYGIFFYVFFEAQREEEVVEFVGDVPYVHYSELKAYFEEMGFEFEALEGDEDDDLLFGYKGDMIITYSEWPNGMSFELQYMIDGHDNSDFVHASRILVESAYPDGEGLTWLENTARKVYIAEANGEYFGSFYPEEFKFDYGDLGIEGKQLMYTIKKYDCMSDSRFCQIKGNSYSLDLVIANIPPEEDR